MPRRGAARRVLAPCVTLLPLVSTRYIMHRVPAVPVDLARPTAGGSPAQ